MRSTVIIHCFLLMLALPVVMPAVAQPKPGRGSLVAYKRSSMPGTFPKGEGSEKTGLPSGGPKPIVQYFIYMLDAPATATMEKLVLEGKSFSVTVQQVTQLPVVMESGMPGRFGTSDTLVDASHAKVLRLIPLEPDNKSLTGKLKRLSRKQAIVLVYRDQGTRYYCSVEKFKNLKPVVLQ